MCSALADKHNSVPLSFLLVWFDKTGLRAMMNKGLDAFNVFLSSYMNPRLHFLKNMMALSCLFFMESLNNWEHL